MTGPEIFGALEIATGIGRDERASDDVGDGNRDPGDRDGAQTRMAVITFPGQAAANPSIPVMYLLVTTSRPLGARCADSVGITRTVGSVAVPGALCLVVAAAPAAA